MGPYEQVSPSMSDDELKEAWAELEDVLVDEDGLLLSDWHGYPAGTDREEIWLDFDAAYSAGVHALMFPDEGRDKGVTRRYGSLREWFDAKLEALMGAASPWPACWGTQLHVDRSGSYVSMDAVSRELPTWADIDLFRCLGAIYAYGDMGVADEREVANHILDPAWLSDAAERFEDEGGPMYSLTCIPMEDMGPDELMDLASMRPELFRDDVLAQWPELAPYAAASRYGYGERSWFSYESWFAGLHSETELRGRYRDEVGDPEALSFDRWIRALEETGAALPCGTVDIVCGEIAVSEPRVVGIEDIRGAAVEASQVYRGHDEAILDGVSR